MKKARLIISASMLTLAGFTALTFSSCTKDNEDCAAGLEGKNCDVEIRTPMLGTYNATDVNDADATDIYAYTPVVSTNTSVSIVNISNFGGFYEGQEIVTSNVSKSGDNISFTIPSQKPDDINEVSGSGTYNVDTKKISVNYTLTSALGQKVNYTGSWTKQ